MKIFIMLFILFILSIGCNDEKKIEKKYQIEKKNSENKDIGIETNDLDFDSFFNKFSSDSIFQKKRVKYPLHITSYHFDINELKEIHEVEIVSDMSKFNFIDFTNDKNAMKNEFDKYRVNIEKLDSITNYKLQGYDNGLKINYKFKLIKGLWYLIEINDEST